MFLCKISFSSSSNARLPFSILKENKTLYLESANGRYSVRKMFFFVTSPWCRHWLTCFARKSYSHKSVFSPDYFTRDGIRKEFGRNSAVYLQQMNSELVLFAGYSIIRQNTSKLFVKDIKGKCHFLRKQAKTSKEYHNIPVKYVNLYQNTWFYRPFCQGAWVCPPLDYTPEHVNIPFLFNGILSVVPQLFTIQSTSNSLVNHTSEHLFYKTVPSRCFQFFC